MRAEIRAFWEHHDALDARVARDGAAVTVAEMMRLEELREVVRVAYERQPSGSIGGVRGGMTVFRSPMPDLPSLESLTTKWGLDPEALDQQAGKSSVGHPFGPMTEDQERQVTELLDEGVSDNEIERRTGISHQRVGRFAKRKGLRDP